MKNSVLFSIVILTQMCLGNDATSSKTNIRSAVESGQMVSLDKGCYTDTHKKPIKVCVEKFSLDSREVSNAEYFKVTGKKAHYTDTTCYTLRPDSLEEYSFKFGIIDSEFQKGDYPAVCVTQHEAQKYCETIGKRLPSKNELVYASKAGTRTTYFWGNDPNRGCDYANASDILLNFNNNKSHGQMKCNDGFGFSIAPVGNYAPNPWGFFDILGNAQEWTSTLDAKKIYASIFGGNYLMPPEGIIPEEQMFFHPDSSIEFLGFRCASSETYFQKNKGMTDSLRVNFLDGNGTILTDGVVSCSFAKTCLVKAKPGSHTIQAHRAGFIDSVFTISLPSSNLVNVALKSIEGQMSIQVIDRETKDTIQAQLFLNDSALAQTPWTGNIAIMAQHLRVQKEGYIPFEIQERASRNSSKNITVFLQKIKILPNIETVSVKGGCFKMGSKKGESNERPVHEVCVSPFEIDKNEVTNESFQSVMGQNPHYTDKSCQIFKGTFWSEKGTPVNYTDPRLPISCVDWNQADLFCKTQGKRLPTEAEWEFAMRAGSQSEWPCGAKGECIRNFAWDENNASAQAHEVGSKYANAWGIYDMAGNVMEWVNDLYEFDAYKTSAKQNPQGATNGIFHTVRGGSFATPDNFARSAYRIPFRPEEYRDDIGFRCVKAMRN